MKEKLKQSKGITLIALIITIIVMMILVGVTVNVALNGGLIDTGKEAAKETEKNMVYEKIIGAMKLKGDGSINVKATYDEVVKIFGDDKVNPTNPTTVDVNTAEVTFTVAGKRGTYTYKITESKIEIGTSNGNEPPAPPKDSIILEDILGTYTMFKDDDEIELKDNGTYVLDGDLGNYTYDEDTKTITNTTMGISGPVNIVGENKTFAMYMSNYSAIIFTSNGAEGLLSNELLNIEFKYEDENSGTVETLVFDSTGHATLTQSSNSGQSNSSTTGWYLMFSRISDGTTEGNDTKVIIDGQIYTIQRDNGIIVSITDDEEDIVYKNPNDDSNSAIDNYATIYDAKLLESDRYYIKLKEKNNVEIDMGEVYKGTYEPKELQNGSTITFNVKDEEGNAINWEAVCDSIKYYEIGSGEDKNVIIAMISESDKIISLFTTNGLKGLEVTELVGKTIKADFSRIDTGVNSLTFNDNNKCIDNNGDDYYYCSLNGINNYDSNYLVINKCIYKIEKDSNGNITLAEVN